MGFTINTSASRPDSSRSHRRPRFQREQLRPHCPLTFRGCSALLQTRPDHCLLCRAGRLSPRQCGARGSSTHTFRVFGTHNTPRRHLDTLIAPPVPPERLLPGREVSVVPTTNHAPGGVEALRGNHADLRGLEADPPGSGCQARDRAARFFPSGLEPVSLSGLDFVVGGGPPWTFVAE